MLFASNASISNDKKDLILCINLQLYINCHAAFALFEDDKGIDVKVGDFGMVA